MRKGGGTLAIIAGSLALLTSLFGLVVGGVVGEFSDENLFAVTWLPLGLAILILTLGIIVLNSTNKILAIVIVVAGLFGTVLGFGYGGPLVFFGVFCLMGILGGVLALLGLIQEQKQSEGSTG